LDINVYCTISLKSTFDFLHETTTANIILKIVFLTAAPLLAYSDPSDGINAWQIQGPYEYFKRREVKGQSMFPVIFILSPFFGSRKIKPS